MAGFSMTTLQIALTAGHDRSLHTLLLAERLLARGHRIVGVWITTPFNLARVQYLLRTRGRAFLTRGFKKFFGKLDPIADAPMVEALNHLDLPGRSLRMWCKARQVPHFTTRDLNSPESIEQLREVAPDGVIYTGGGILRPRFLQAVQGRVLNAHMGPVPDVRGMNALEWSLLLGFSPTVTIHRIDAGVDTGPVLSKIRLTFPPGSSDLDQMRSMGTLMAMDELAKWADHLPTLDRLEAMPNADRNRQCFVLAPILKERLIARLHRNGGQ